MGRSIPGLGFTDSPIPLMSELATLVTIVGSQVNHMRLGCGPHERTLPPDARSSLGDHDESPTRTRSHRTTFRIRTASRDPSAPVHCHRVRRWNSRASSSRRRIVGSTEPVASLTFDASKQFLTDGSAENGSEHPIGWWYGGTDPEGYRYEWSNAEATEGSRSLMFEKALRLAPHATCVAHFPDQTDLFHN